VLRNSTFPSFQLIIQVVSVQSSDGMFTPGNLNPLIVQSEAYAVIFGAQYSLSLDLPRPSIASRRALVDFGGPVGSAVGARVEVAYQESQILGITNKDETLTFIL